MTDPNNLTPPPELLQAWINQEDGLTAAHIATQAARWGADAELEACVKWVALQFYGHPTWATELRAARRPKQPSLKEQALKALLHMDQGQHNERAMIIRRALEQLPDAPTATPDPAPDGGEPLWKLMQDAHDKAATNRGGYAAELRAVADELERRQMKQVFQDLDDVIDWLRTEADRAGSDN